jgi:hypothetical protein
VSNKIVETAQRSMGTDDKVEKTYPGTIDGKYGYLVMTRKKLLFLKEEGFIGKSYNVTYSIPYEKMRDVSVNEKYKLEISDLTFGKKVFVSEIAASTIETSLNSLRNTGRITAPVP